MGIEDIRKKFVVDNIEEKTEEDKKIEINKKQDNRNSIVNIEISKLVAFRKRQPFSMYDKRKKQEMLESIKENGVLVPIIIRKINNEKYEIIAGHNRVECSKELELSTIPAQIVECDDAKATLIMLDTNLCNRDKISPMERAYAYKMKMEILKNNSNIENIKEYIENSPEEKETSIAHLYRFIRLTELIKPLQEKVDSELIPIKSGVEISYLNNEEQEIINQVLEDEKVKLSLAQAQKIRLKEQDITYETVLNIIKNQNKKEVKFTGKLDKKVYKEYKAKFNSDEEFSNLIKQLLDNYFRATNGA